MARKQDALKPRQYTAEDIAAAYAHLLMLPVDQYKQSLALLWKTINLCQEPAIENEQCFEISIQGQRSLILRQEKPFFCKGDYIPGAGLASIIAASLNPALFSNEELQKMEYVARRYHLTPKIRKAQGIYIFETGFRQIELHEIFYSLDYAI